MECAVRLSIFLWDFDNMSLTGICNYVSFFPTWPLRLLLRSKWWFILFGNFNINTSQTFVEITRIPSNRMRFNHYRDVIMGAMAFQITSLTIVYSTVHSRADQRKHQSSASLAFVRGIHRWPVNSLHKYPVTRKMFPFEDVIMWYLWLAVIFIQVSMW